MNVLKLEKTFRDRCEKIATEYRLDLGLKAYERLPADILAAKLEVEVHPPAYYEKERANQLQLLLKSNAWSAAIIGTNPWQVVYNPQHYATRYESDVMHELGHILLNHSFAHFNSETGVFDHNDRKEAEAIYLGSCLQIPRRGLAWAIGRGLSVEEIALHFGASVAMVNFRCNTSGFKSVAQQASGQAS